MLRLITNEGVPVAPEGDAMGARKARPAIAADAVPSAANLNSGCEIELCSIVAITLVDGMLRTGIARPESAEAILTDIADRYEAIIATAPDNIRDTAEWENISRRLKASAAKIRSHVIEMVLGE